MQEFNSAATHTHTHTGNEIKEGSIAQGRSVPEQQIAESNPTQASRLLADLYGRTFLFIAALPYF